VILGLITIWYKYTNGRKDSNGRGNSRKIPNDVFGIKLSVVMQTNKTGY